MEKENGNRSQHKRTKRADTKHTQCERERVPPSQQHKKREQENAKRTLILRARVRERERDKHKRECRVESHTFRLPADIGVVAQSLAYLAHNDDALL